MNKVKVSNKFQIAVPSAARKKLDIEAGDYLLVDIRENFIVLMPEPQSYSRYLRGLHREIWENLDPEEYVHQERDAWRS